MAESVRSDDELRFNQAMVEIYRRAKAEAGYTATRLAQMLSERGGLATARYLLWTPTVSEGFTALWEAHRLDLTVEAHVLLPAFTDLFTPSEIEIAKQRLQRYGYSFD